MKPILFLLCLLFISLLPAGFSQKNVAIIGGGIGGATTAFYLNQFAPDVKIDVFEKETIVGGRLKHVTFAGAVCEVGGDAWSSVNTYLMQLMKQLDVPMSNNSYDGNGNTGFYEGNRKWLQVKESYLSEARLLAQVEIFRFKLAENYKTRDKHDIPFKTIEEFVEAGGINKYTSVNMRDFLKSHSINDDLAEGEIEPVIRGIYDQNLNVSAFAGIVSILPALTDAFSVMGGNSLLVEMLLNNSKANINLDTPVSDVLWNGNGYQITYGDNSVSSTVYDNVVLAHPFEFGNITFTNVSLPSLSPRPYRHWFVTLVSASGLQPSYFGKQIIPIPDNVFTTENSTAPFVVVYPIAQSPNGNPVYKIFSNVAMDSYLDSIFTDVSDSFVQIWNYTFPDLSPQSTYQPIELSSGLYYANTMESVATAMECSTIAGRNIALLISQEN